MVPSLAVRPAEEILGKMRQAEVMMGQGRTVVAVCRELGVTEVTNFHWCKEYGGLKLDQARRLKGPEKENARLRWAAAELTPDNQILKETFRGILTSPVTNIRA